MEWNKATIGIVVVGVVLVCELAMIVIMPMTGSPAPNWMEGIVIGTLGVLVGLTGGNGVSGGLRRK